MRKLLFLLFLLPVFVIAQSTEKNFPSDISLETLDGKTENLSAYRSKPVVLDFFATWCKPCIVKYNSMKTYYETWQKEYGVQIILVSIDRQEDIDKIKNLKEKYDWPFKIILDSKQILFTRLNGGNRSVPSSFFFTAQGDLKAISSGAKISIKGESEENTLGRLYDDNTKMSDVEVDLDEYLQNIKAISN